MQNKITKFIISLGFAVLTANPLFVYAQTTPAATSTTKTPPAQAPADLPVYNAGVDRSIQDYLCTPSDPADGHDLERCINRLYKFGITTGALVLVFMIVYAGYVYITSGEAGKTKAKSYITNSLVGMGVLLGSYVLLYFLNPTLVQFKPVQPPIFNADELPTCEELGFNNNCLISDVHGSGVENVSSGGTLAKGTATACKGGLVSTPSSIPHAAGASTLCKDLADKLSGLKAKTSGISWILTSSISGTHSSSCHGSGNANSGNCVDLALNGGRSPSYDKNNGGSTNPQWGALCTAIASLGSVNFANEASNQAACQSLKPYKVETYTTGPNIHINYIGN